MLTFILLFVVTSYSASIWDIKSYDKPLRKYIDPIQAYNDSISTYSSFDKEKEDSIQLLRYQDSIICRNGRENVDITVRIRNIISFNDTKYVLYEVSNEGEVPLLIEKPEYLFKPETLKDVKKKIYKYGRVDRLKTHTLFPRTSHNGILEISNVDLCLKLPSNQFMLKDPSIEYFQLTIPYSFIFRRDFLREGTGWESSYLYSRSSISTILHNTNLIPSYNYYRSRSQTHLKYRLAR